MEGGERQIYRADVIVRKIRIDRTSSPAPEGELERKRREQVLFGEEDAIDFC